MDHLVTITRIKTLQQLNHQTDGIVLETEIYRGSNAPGEATYSLGRFCNDYGYVERLGDLDANNGRFCVTPRFPNGTYAYFMTTDSNETPTFPYSIGEAYYNVPVEENWKTKSKQDFLPDRVRRAQNENDQTNC